MQVYGISYLYLEDVVSSSHLSYSYSPEHQDMLVPETFEVDLVGKEHSCLVDPLVVRCTVLLICYNCDCQWAIRL